MAFNLGAFGQGFASGMNAGANLMMTRERLKDAKEARAERERTRAEEKGWLDNFNSTAGGIYKDFGGDAAGVGDAGIETPGPNSMAGRIGGPKEVNGKPAGQGFLTDDIGGNDKYNLLGREKVAGADTFGSMGEAIDAGLRQIDDGMADFRGRMRGGLASYVENADKFPQYAYQSAMEEPYGIRETAAHKLALGYYGKSTGDPATEITIDKDGNLWRWIPNEGTDEQGRPLAPARFMTPRSELQKMLDETGNGRKWDAFTKRYLSKDAWETSRTAWVLDRGEGYFTGMTSKEIRADYNSWKAEKQSLARQGRLDAMAADEAAQKKALNEARINEANARAEHYRNTGAGGTGATNAAKLRTEEAKAALYRARAQALNKQPQEGYVDWTPSEVGQIIKNAESDVGRIDAELMKLEGDVSGTTGSTGQLQKAQDELKRLGKRATAQERERAQAKVDGIQRRINDLYTRRQKILDDADALRRRGKRVGTDKPGGGSSFSRALGGDGGGAQGGDNTQGVEKWFIDDMDDED